MFSWNEIGDLLTYDSSQHDLCISNGFTWNIVTNLLKNFQATIYVIATFQLGDYFRPINKGTNSQIFLKTI